MFSEISMRALFQRLTQDLETSVILGLIKHVQLVNPEEPEQEGQPVFERSLVWLPLVGLR